MYEEMSDKKSGLWSAQANSKSNSEPKKNQDSSSGKAFPKNARKREPPNYNAKPDPNRKPVPQKSKAFDKRPKPRGLGFGGSRKENCQITDEEFEAEFGFIFDGGKKQRSLNHLTNFHYEPRSDNTLRNRGANHYPQTTRSLMATQAHKYNKEQFLQANCQFVVREGEDYSFNLGDPDLLVDWDRVELIIISSCEAVICPICLYPPVAGKITRCGHVYCWSCVLHYLALSDKTWRKCPICYESIHKKDLKSVECIEKAQYRVEEEIRMRLMKRERGSQVVSPVSQYGARTLKPILSYGEAHFDTTYSKLLTASKPIVMNIITRENSELQAQVEEFKGCPELCFVEQALTFLAERKDSLENQKENFEEQVGIPEPTHESPNLTIIEETLPVDNAGNLLNPPDPGFKQPIQRLESESTGSEGDEAGENISPEDLEIKSGNSSQKYFYFYQASDGQHIYLHSLNVRMLEMTYGTLEQSPIEISGRIVEKESGSMTPQLRKRLRYLQHIPITCQFEVTELELRPSIVSEETIAHFQDQIEERARRRARQARAEKRREKKIEESEKWQYARRPAPNLRLESHVHFPEFGLDDLPGLLPLKETPESKETVDSGQSSRAGSPKRDKSPFSSAVAALSLDCDESSSGPSFAQALRVGKTISNELWPSIGGGTVGSGCGDRNGSGGGWGRRTRQISITQEHPDSDNDTAFSPPAKPSFNIAEAIQLAASIEKGEISGGGGRKKKKKHQKILFSTGIPKGH